MRSIRTEKRCAELERKWKDAIARAEAAEAELARLNGAAAQPPTAGRPDSGTGPERPAPTAEASPEDLVVDDFVLERTAVTTKDEVYLLINGHVTNKGSVMMPSVVIHGSARKLRGIDGQGACQLVTKGTSAEETVLNLAPGERRAYELHLLVRERIDPIIDRWEAEDLKVTAKLK